ncbi:MAG: 2Fe-2S iron-sulfur cluster binding domain-containing protein [Bacteroidetes bacterium]|nr:2Fe-2S iron-sulfur cluster binding domain-containing protein [Bacteroidota bacterium]
MNDNSIKLVIIENGAKQIIQTHPGEYRNLMMLLRDKLFLEGFGECGGMGRCATCIIKTKGINGISNIKERNEPATLSKLGFHENDIRLSCQLLITPDLDNAEIEIMEY